MQFLVFALTYPFIWVLSKLPMRILYIKSDVFFFLIYYVFGYRKQVVVANLKMAFPEKTDDEINSISKKFFRHLMDLLMESVKAFSISEKEIKKRFKLKNPELINNYEKEGKSMIIMGAHQANWEWTVSMPLGLNIPIYGAYTKLNNKYFERVVKASRSKFGCVPYKGNSAIIGTQYNLDNNIQAAYILLSDQSPQPHKTFYWRDFFDIKVPVHTGAEMLAKKFDFVVINYVVKKIKRGYYEVDFQLITETPKKFKDYEITDKYTTLTEQNILKQPELYLWSHKRFKHRNKVPKEFQ